jgi:hypothetical protein
MSRRRLALQISCQALRRGTHLDRGLRLLYETHRSGIWGKDAGCGGPVGARFTRGFFDVRTDGDNLLKSTLSRKKAEGFSFKGMI